MPNSISKNSKIKDATKKALKYSKKLQGSKVCSNEYILKNTALKKTELTFCNIELVKDAIKEFAYANHAGQDFSIAFFGEIAQTFRAVVLIGDGDLVFTTDLSGLDTKYSFGVFNSDIPEIKNATILKLDLDKLLQITLEYISAERFQGGYFAKGRFLGKNPADLKFIGICGDIKNENFIESINLDELVLTLPELSENNDFYISKFLDE